MRDLRAVSSAAAEAYRERKRQVAITRCAIVDTLMDQRAAEDRGELDVAMQAAVVASMLCDDLLALLEEWRAEYPEDAPTPLSAVASTSLVT